MADTARPSGCCAQLFCVFFIGGLLVLTGAVLSLLTDITTAIRTIPLSKYPILEVNSIRVSNLNLSNPISAHWNLNMNITKFGHNDISFEFNHDTKISIFHETRNEALWMTSLKPFVVRPNNPTAHFVVDFWGSSANVDGTSTVQAIAQEIANHGAVKFKVRFDANWPGIRYKHWIENRWWDTNINMLISSCDVGMFFGSLDNGRADMLMYDSDHACTHQVF